MIAILALALVAGAPTALERSRAALADADFEGALTLAEAAEVEAVDRVALGEVYRQQGLVREVLGRADHAMIAFARAIRCDPTIELDKRTAKRSTAELFVLARALHESGADIVRVRKRLDARIGRDETVCTSSLARVAPELVAKPAPAAAATPWPVWGLGGLGIVGGAAAGILGALAVSKDGECKSQVSHVTYSSCDAAASRLELGANVAWAGAGVAAASAVLIWFVTSEE